VRNNIGNRRCNLATVSGVTVELEPAPKTKRPIGEPCCEPLVVPAVNREQAARLAQLAKMLGDPTRLQLVDVLRRHGGDVCVCELQPLFEIKQSTLSEHLKKLRDAGLVGVERRGLWAYYYVIPEAMEDLKSWLS
jgi:ArsR family transcriptional regulator, arsenate/arsenite/antimonite-responsive transcriptional repressor